MIRGTSSGPNILGRNTCNARLNASNSLLRYVVSPYYLLYYFIICLSNIIEQSDTL